MLQTRKTAGFLISGRRRKVDAQFLAAATLAAVLAFWHWLVRSYPDNTMSVAWTPGTPRPPKCNQRGWWYIYGGTWVIFNTLIPDDERGLKSEQQPTATHDGTER